LADNVLDAQYFTDLQFSGLYWPQIEIGGISEEEVTMNTNTVKLVLYSLSQKELEYMNALGAETYGNGNIFSGAPANVPTNIYNVTEDSEGLDGIGFFGASDKFVVEKTFYREPDNK
jgi:hypothetical protein